MRIGKENLLSFDQVQAMIAERADRNYGDHVYDLRSVEFQESGRVYVPNMGLLQLSEWAKSQLSTRLGVRWDTWFEGSNTKEIQEEVQRRFDRGTNHMLVRARQHAPDKKSERVQSDGMLRAFLSPNYPVGILDDRWVFDRMQAALGHRINDMHFLPSRTTEDDKSSHFVMFSPTDGIEMGAKGDATDIMYPGMKIRNSEVGFSALSVDDFWFRLMCLNGMMYVEQDERLLYRTHKNINEDDFDGLLIHMMEIADARQQDAAQRYAVAKDVRFSSNAEAKEKLTAYLERKHVARIIVDLTRRAYDREPEPNGFGLMNAITRAARDLADRNQRHDLEHLAGKFLVDITSPGRGRGGNA